LVRNASLREITAFAYGIADDREDELIASPGLLRRSFDIEATCWLEPPREQVTRTMQTLLAERFGLRTHREERNGRLCSRKTTRVEVLHPSSSGAPQSLDASFTCSQGRVTGRATSMQAVANHLSGPVFKLGRPVADETGFQGVYDFTLVWAPGVVGRRRFRALDLHAIQEQLGHRLEARRISVQALV
jgi:uncharacterized protein (TIGR03435 family)